MNLDLILANQITINKETLHVLALVTLELDHLTEFFVLHDIAIAAKFFLERLQDLVVAEIFWQALNCC